MAIRRPVSPRPIRLATCSKALRTRLWTSPISTEASGSVFPTTSGKRSGGRTARLSRERSRGQADVGEGLRDAWRGMIRVLRSLLPPGERTTAAAGRLAVIGVAQVPGKQEPHGRPTCASDSVLAMLAAWYERA